MVGSTGTLTDTVGRLAALLRLLRVRTGGADVRRTLGSAAVLGVLAIILRFLLSRGASTSKLLRRAGQPIKGTRDGEAQEEYDIVIAGGGTAGCVLASRLSEDPAIRVLLLESGGRRVASIGALTQTPLLYTQTFNTKQSHNLWTVPQEHANGKARFWPRGRYLGGCSAVNAMVFHYGAPSDYDEWAELQKGLEGANEWTFKQFNQYFLKFEKFHPSKKFSLVDTVLRGSAGPVNIGYYGNIAESTVAFIEACERAGIPRNPDFNTPKGTLGANKVLTFIDSRSRRVSTESAYLTPEVLSRPNLTVITHAQVTRILFAGGRARPRAVGVRYESRSGEQFEVKARKEVVVCAGALHTPQILMLSGVGPANHLNVHNIPVVADLPVGSNLMDHPVVDLHFKDKTKSEISGIPWVVRKAEQGNVAAILKVAKVMLQYQLFSTGPLRCNIAEALAFVRSSDETLFPPEKFSEPVADATSGPEAPDIEFFFSPLTYFEHGHGAVASGHYFAMHAITVRPTSVGTVQLKSADPHDPPVIDPKYLSTEHDIACLVRGVRLLSRIARTEPLASMIEHAGDEPFLNHNMHTWSDEQIADLIRERVQTLYHPTSTARMAPLEEGGVVDTRLRVHGIPNLRVVDASVFPKITSGHTVSPTIAVAEKAADMIKDAFRSASIY
ncbi:GMC oxidoreductase [Wolfiporia cocos MD-104 SS10]|uniref:GMC oxidoreductase n=1 Tax=Wolfiporia cocos (strain MD-104) TaxID=742152 RepID=A0A2H3JAY9_WOLCO|nr:GMC oxidoreductase [Wolfiporia cocos MD-104 SS10]